VLSGIPQESVLERLLFLIFVNDIDSDIKSILVKFADNTKLFPKANSDGNKKELQDDMNKLCEWAKRWQMKFSVDKNLCNYAHRMWKQQVSV